MPSIRIGEVDNTLSVSAISDTDVVYVAGFVTIEDSKFDPSTIVNPNTPTLCKTIEEFEAFFGTEPAKFSTAQTYQGFAQNAVPVGVPMYEQGDEDLSYIYAKELIARGISVVYERINAIGAPATVADMYDALAGTGPVDVFENLKDKGEYTVKYLTTGGYPSFEYYGVSEGGNIIVNKMLSCASERGDCVALIDPTDNPDRVLIPSNTTSVYYSATNTNSSYKIGTNGSYGVIANPTWVNVTCDINGTSESMPPSYCYLTALAKSIQDGNPNFLSIAGVSRGFIPNFISLHTNKVLTNAIANGYETDTGISINAITNIKPYGYCFWGNRTLLNNAVAGDKTAFSFLNLRNLVSDIKKVVYTTAKRYTFEQNTDVLQVNFQNAVEPTLKAMKSGNGIKNYSFKFNKTSDKTKLSVTIKIIPIYAVEDFDISIVMENEEVTVA